MFVRRATAARVAIREVVEGTLVTSEEGSVIGIKTPLGQVNRVNVVATVVDRFESSPEREDTSGGLATLTLDDGTGVIRVKLWGELSKKLELIQVGDLVRVIGKIRSFQGETYVNGEIVRRLENPNWDTVRLLEQKLSETSPRPIKHITELPAEDEIAEQPAIAHPRQVELAPAVWQTAEQTLEQPIDEEVEPMVSMELRRIVLDTIEKQDAKGGARFEQILKAVGDVPEEDVEQVLIDLLSEGLVYEPEIHRYKKS